MVNLKLHNLVKCSIILHSTRDQCHCGKASRVADVVKFTYDTEEMICALY